MNHRQVLELRFFLRVTEVLFRNTTTRCKAARAQKEAPAQSGGMKAAPLQRRCGLLVRAVGVIFTPWERGGRRGRELPFCGRGWPFFCGSGFGLSSSFLGMGSGQPNKEDGGWQSFSFFLGSEGPCALGATRRERDPSGNQGPSAGVQQRTDSCRASWTRPSRLSLTFKVKYAIVKLPLARCCAHTFLSRPAGYRVQRQGRQSRYPRVQLRFARCCKHTFLDQQGAVSNGKNTIMEYAMFKLKIARCCEQACMGQRRDPARAAFRSRHTWCRPKQSAL